MLVLSYFDPLTYFESVNLLYSSKQSDVHAKTTNLSSLQVKYLVLVLLVVQNVATILSMKQASTQNARDGHYVLTTAIVLMVEILKMTVCTGEILIR